MTRHVNPEGYNQPEFTNHQAPAELAGLFKEVEEAYDRTYVSGNDTVNMRGGRTPAEHMGVSYEVRMNPSLGARALGHAAFLDSRLASTTDVAMRKRGEHLAPIPTPKVAETEEEPSYDLGHTL